VSGYTKCKNQNDLAGEVLKHQIDRTVFHPITQKIKIKILFFNIQSPRKLADNIPHKP
jgi:hypothetical protein